jgi:hypothetical protein
MDLSKSIAWVAFAAIVGVTGLGKHPSSADKPAAKPADTRPLKTQIAQRESHKTRSWALWRTARCRWCAPARPDARRGSCRPQATARLAAHLPDELAGNWSGFAWPE